MNFVSQRIFVRSLVDYWLVIVFVLHDKGVADAIDASNSVAELQFADGEHSLANIVQLCDSRWPAVADMKIPKCSLRVKVSPIH